MTTDTGYRKLYDLDRARGIRRTLPADPVREHVRRLLGAGASVRGIADAAGVSPSAVSTLNSGATRAVRCDLAAKVLAVTMADVRGRGLVTGFVPNTGARRRIRALLALGWRHEDITAYLAGTGTRTPMVLHQRGGWITRATHDAVRAAYDALSMRPGPSARTRERARALGYVPPLAWDDDSIDDPAARPLTDDGEDPVVDDIAVDRALKCGSLAGLTVPERLAAVARLVDQGVTAPGAIAHRLGTSTGVALRLQRLLPPPRLGAAQTRPPTATPCTP